MFVECKSSCEPECGGSFNDSTTLNCGCVHGCVCKPGMIRNATSKKCFSIKKCQQNLLNLKKTTLCGDNEHFSETEAGCQPSCYTIHENVETCPSKAGCVCNNGYVRAGKTGGCVPIIKCPSKVFVFLISTSNYNFSLGCRTNEDWIPCSNCTTFECENSCGTCVCRRGFIPFKGHCIRDCAHRSCYKNEEYLNCSNCENCCFNNPRTTCDKNGCYEGCFCKKDLIRDPLIDSCVEAFKCPGQFLYKLSSTFNLISSNKQQGRCRVNEKLVCRFKECAKTCQNYNDPCEPTTAECVNSCFCRDGFVRISAINNTCIHFSDC